MENNSISAFELSLGYVNAARAMQLLNVKSTTLYYLREREKVLAYSKIGKKIFYQIESIKKLLEKNSKNVS
jgi:hypothetical protein